MRVKEYLKDDMLRIELLQKWLEAREQHECCPLTFVRDAIEEFEMDEDDIERVDSFCAEFCNKVFPKTKLGQGIKGCPCGSYTQEHVVKKVKEWLTKVQDESC